MSFLILILLTFGMVEASLRLFDPLGVQAYYQWLAFAHNERIPHVTGYSYPTGVYTVQGHTVTIDDIGNRITPQRDNAACTVAFIGDSVTFGFGTSDDETFAYRLADALPGVQMINTGKAGYDSLNLALSVIDAEADLYVYLVVGNDAGEPTWHGTHFDNRIAIRNMLMYFHASSLTYTIEHDLYAQTLDVLEYFDVLYVGLDDNQATRIAQQRVDILMLPAIERISIADQHPTAQGHETIADAILPHLTARLQEHC